MPLFSSRRSRLLTLLASVCAVSAPVAAMAQTQQVAAPGSAVTAPDHYGEWGFDLAGRDTSITPGDNFFGYANGKAVKNLVIPADKTSYGPFEQLRELSRSRVNDILTQASASVPDAPKSDSDKLGVFFKSFMDEAAVAKLGKAPLAHDIAAIRGVDSQAAFAHLVGSSQFSFQFSPFGLDIQPDAKDPRKFTLSLDQSGLGLPDRDYYLKPEFDSKKKAYRAYIVHMLELTGWNDAEKQADAIVAFETELAKVHWAREDLRNPDKIYNPRTVAELQKEAPGFDWTAWLKGAGIPDKMAESGTVIVGEPSAITGEAKILGETPLPVLQAWLAFHLTDNAAPYLSEPFVQASWEFNNHTLAGQPQQEPRWKRAVSATSHAMGWAIGEEYVKRYFPQESRTKMAALTRNLKAAFHARLDHNSWMSPETRKAAIRKLEKFDIQIGYPKKWRDYTSYDVKPGDVYGNAARGIAFEWNYSLSHLGHPVDKDEWDMTPQTVNAYNNPLFNEVVFPASILQPPFFDPKADPAINYGAIGGVIGHEMTHGFDDEGRKFDENGRLHDWWTKEDARRFEEQASRLGKQYDAFEVLPGVHLNGKLTMGENIADLGGLTLALDAYHASLKGKPAPVVDGLTGDQRVFLGWAQVWRMKVRDDRARQLAVIDPHSAPKARVNIPMHNIDLWYKAWDVKPGQSLYLLPDQRVTIW
ncbi:peptidase M13 [Acetobacter sp. AN02]|uniref:M13 family metallopeptidase n=1 Tax=Acetobacter sp. AN02 TaxID=2894186 RepID=UPI0024342FAE|nr:M13-type metalloendopeptidase [Acetobacter sp. AN02]MDG6094088.1 peptidase M13 [Acetobacter sp. AN02]